MILGKLNSENCWNKIMAACFCGCIAMKEEKYGVDRLVRDLYLWITLTPHFS